MITFQKQKLCKDSKAISAPVLNIDFIHAVLEAINYLVFEIINKTQLLVDTI